MKSKFSKTTVIFGIIGLLAAVAVIGFLRIPCPVYSLFGIRCPGCGMTRAWLAALRLDLAAAFSYHPLFWSVPLVIVYACNNGRLFGKRVDRIVLWGLLIAVIILFVVRL